MIGAEYPLPAAAKLLVVDAKGRIRHRKRRDLQDMFEPGDLVVANDAATLPASLTGIHAATGNAIEVRLAAWLSLDDPSRFVAIAFGDGDFRTPTEDRPPPPRLANGDRLHLGPLVATVERMLVHARLIELRFAGTSDAILAGIARHGQPIQYAHVPAPLALWDAWTPVAALPIAFEPPSAGFALSWRMLAAWRRRGVAFATLTHAAGISSTGDAVLDRCLPFDEPYRIPGSTATAIARTRARGGRVISIGTTVVRALESAADERGSVRAGYGVATGRIGAGSMLNVVDAILTGVHQRGESHFDLLGAFASGRVLDRMSAAAVAHAYRGHEFGDSVLVERAATPEPAYSTTAMIGPYRDQESLRRSSGA